MKPRRRVRALIMNLTSEKSQELIIALLRDKKFLDFPQRVYSDVSRIYGVAILINGSRPIPPKIP